MPKYTVVPGDCFNSLAKEHGFFNYRTIYKHGENEARWPNPNQLEEGGSVDLPDKKRKWLPLTLDKETRFVIDRQKTRLRLVLLDSAFRRLDVTSCTLKVGPTYKKLPKDGLLEVADLDPAVKNGTLTIKLKLTSAAAPAGTAPKPDPKAYPPAIKPTDFTDKLPKTKELATISWNLSIGTLEHYSATRGVLQRLLNLGFGCPLQQTEDDKTKRAAKAYQVFRKLATKEAATGKVADIRAYLVTRHDLL
jgi:hypothetical protein